MWNQEFVATALALSPFAVGALTVTIAKGYQLAEHAIAHLKVSQNSKVNTEVRAALTWALNEADSLAKQTVVAANEQFVNPYKATGTWDKAAEARVFKTVLQTVEGNLSKAAHTVLTTQLPSLPERLTNLIESHVATAPNKYKRSTPASTDPAPVPQAAPTAAS